MSEGTRVGRAWYMLTTILLTLWLVALWIGAIIWQALRRRRLDAP